METSAAPRPIPGPASDESLVAAIRDGSEPACEGLAQRRALAQALPIGPTDGLRHPSFDPSG